MKRRVYEEIESAKGFYLGDICYVLGNDLYYGVWREKYHYSRGVFEDPETGLKVAVASTEYGDGRYQGSDGTKFPVDAGVIGLVPLELVEKESGLEDGRVIEAPGTALFEAEDGQFRITAPSGEIITIDTSYDCDYWDDDEEDDGDDE